MAMYQPVAAFIALAIAVSFTAGNPYLSYILSNDTAKIVEWSNSSALSYISTVRLFDHDHHLFQYRPYPCQYFYTDEIQLNYNNETIHYCLYNTSSSDYQYRFQLFLDSRHIEPYILRNIAIQCIYINCSLSLLNINYLTIDWSSKGRENNPDCTFDVTHLYKIANAPHPVSEWITLRCQSLSACNHSRLNLEQTLLSQIQLTYGSTYDIQAPYCSLEKSLGHMFETNFAKTNLLLQQMMDLFQRGFGTPDPREQAKLKDYVEHMSTRRRRRHSSHSLVRVVGTKEETNSFFPRH